jgi:hypothetical protein
MFYLDQALGVVGSLLVVAAYFSDQAGWLKSRSFPYLTMNLAGSVGILISLVDAWNLPSAVIEGFWALISIYGLVRLESKRGRADGAQH